MKGVDQDLPQHDHGQVHDQDDRKRPTRAHYVCKHFVLQAASSLEARVMPVYPGPVSLSTIWLIIPVDRHCEPTGRATARPMTGSAKQSIVQPRRQWIACAPGKLAWSCR